MNTAMAITAQHTAIATEITTAEFCLPFLCFNKKNDFFYIFIAECFLLEQFTFILKPCDAQYQIIHVKYVRSLH